IDPSRRACASALARRTSGFWSHQAPARGNRVEAVCRHPVRRDRGRRRERPQIRSFSAQAVMPRPRFAGRRKHVPPAKLMGSRGVDMSRRVFLGCVVFLIAPIVTGCSGPTEVSDEPEMSKLGDTAEVSLQELLTKPRAELAQLAEEWQTKAQLQENGRRE